MEKLVEGLNAGQVPADIDVVVAPPFIFLDWVRANLNDNYAVAAQNVWVSKGGAFTGEISAEMLVDAHVSAYCITRRLYTPFCACVGCLAACSKCASSNLAASNTLLRCQLGRMRDV